MTKKIFVALMLIVMLLCLSACGSKASPAETEATAYDEENIEGGSVFPVKERGICFEVAQEYLDKGVVVEQYNENLKGYKMVSLYYYSPTSNKLLDEVINMDAALRTPEISEAYTQKIWDTSRCLMELVIVPEDEYERQMASGGTAEDFTYYAPAEYYGANDGFAYILSIPQLDDGALSDSEAAEYHICRDYMETVKENMRFLPVELETDETVVGEAMPEFTSTDLWGKEVSNRIFSEKKLTVVNIWGTFCSPCIKELPELAALSEKYSEHAQFLGIVGDVSGMDDTEQLELAQMIIEKTGVSFPNLVMDDSLESLMSGIIGFPTTLFVDSAGNIIGEPIVGSDIKCTEERIQSILN